MNCPEDKKEISFYQSLTVKVAYSHKKIPKVFPHPILLPVLLKIHTLSLYILLKNAQIVGVEIEVKLDVDVIFGFSFGNKLPLKMFLFTI